MITVRQMIVSFRCPLDQVVSWMEFNTIGPKGVAIKKINDNGYHATIEIAGSPEAVIEVGNVAGLFDNRMYEIMVKFL